MRGQKGEIMNAEELDKKISGEIMKDLIVGPMSRFSTN